MRPGPNTRRPRSRGNGNRRHSSSRVQNFESKGPEVKVRGNAQRLVEKYLQLARDASSSGDYVTAENFSQHAEHYYRTQTAINAGFDNRQSGRPGPRDRGGNGAERGADGPRAADGASGADGDAVGSDKPGDSQPETPGADPA